MYTLPSQTTFHVVSRPWPAALPHPVPLSEARGLWLSVVPTLAAFPAYDAAWHGAGYSGLVFVRDRGTWIGYLAGCAPSGAGSLAQAAAEVGLPDALSFAGMRLAATLGRLSDLLAVACHRYDTWRLAVRARRVLREVR